MNRFARGGVVMLLCAVGASVGAQVNRCGDGTYTDKPCHGARAVDLRVNLLDAGPREAPRQRKPAPALIVPDSTRRPGPAASGGSALDRKAQRDAQHENRTHRR